MIDWVVLPHGDRIAADDKAQAERIAKRKYPYGPLEVRSAISLTISQEQRATIEKERRPW